jgi:hypothetical protein
VIRTMSNLSWRRAMWSCILATIPCTAYAVDGVVLIDQSHALAGSITPGDAPGFPVTISQRGSYRLSGNLVVPDANTTAIQIAADHVSLDLNGFSIIGPVACTGSPAVCPTGGQGVGISSGAPETLSSPRGIRVFNGGVRGMGSFGIGIFGAGSIVERVTVDSNAGGGIIINGTVLESAANLNGPFGIFATIVRGSIADDNTGNGIVMDAIGGVAIGNVASFNGQNGILSPNATVTANTMVRNVAFGISAICPSSIVGNTIVGNTQGSIATPSGPTGCVQSDNATRP